MSLNVERISHIAVLVADLDKSIEFFSDLLGTTFSPFIVEEDLKVRSAVCPLGIELMSPTAPDSVFATLLAKRGEGLIGLLLKVPDIEVAQKEMAQRGIRQLHLTHLGRVTEAQFHPKDTFGVTIGLAEYEDRHGAALAALGVDF